MRLNLAAVKRRRIAARAAKLLKRKTVTWKTGHWIRDKTTGQDCDPMMSMGAIRKWWRDHGLDTYNKECSVCLEGALLISAIEDRDVPDEVTGNEVLAEFQKDVLGASVKHVPGTSPDSYAGIAYLNDMGLRHIPEAQKTAIAILAEAGRPEKKVADGD